MRKAARRRYTKKCTKWPGRPQQGSFGGESNVKECRATLLIYREAVSVALTEAEFPCASHSIGLINCRSVLSWSSFSVSSSWSLR